jgi:hypothetical protein
MFDVQTSASTAQIGMGSANGPGRCLARPARGSFPFNQRHGGRLQGPLKIKELSHKYKNLLAHSPKVNTGKLRVFDTPRWVPKLIRQNRPQKNAKPLFSIILLLSNRSNQAVFNPQKHAIYDRFLQQPIYQ